MSSMRLAFSSRRSNRPEPRGPSHEPPVPLSSLRDGQHGVIVDVCVDVRGRMDRLLALGVTPGARVKALQTFPGIVFLCDQTELAVERDVANAILVRVESRS